MQNFSWVAVPPGQWVPEAPRIGRSFNLCVCKAVLRAKTRVYLLLFVK